MQSISTFNVFLKMLQYPFSAIDIFVIADTETKYRFGLVSVAMKVETGVTQNDAYDLYTESFEKKTQGLVIQQNFLYFRDVTQEEPYRNLNFLEEVWDFILQYKTNDQYKVSYIH